MSSHRGDVVVRVRTIAADIANGALGRAQALSQEAAAAAQRASHRATVHPLAGNQGAVAPAELMTAVGVASALREAALSAQRRSELAQESLDHARAVAAAAAAQQKAARRLVDRRVAAANAEEQRRNQRALDETGTTMKGAR